VSAAPRPGEVEALRAALAITAGTLRAGVLVPQIFTDAEATLRWVHPAVLPLAPLLPRLPVRLLDPRSHRGDHWHDDAARLMAEMRGWRELAESMAARYRLG